MTLEISERETRLLEALLNRFIADTKSEIYRTETALYKDALKQQEADAINLLERLTGKPVA